MDIQKEIYEYFITHYSLSPTASCSTYSPADILWEGQRWLIAGAPYDTNFHFILNIPPTPENPFNMFQLGIDKHVCWVDFSMIPHSTESFIARPCSNEPNPCCKTTYTVGWIKKSVRPVGTPLIENPPFVCDIYPFVECKNYCDVYVPDHTAPPLVYTNIYNEKESGNEIFNIKVVDREIIIDKNTKELSISLINVLGREIFRKQYFSSDEIRINTTTEGITSGVYYIILNTRGKSPLFSKILIY